MSKRIPNGTLVYMISDDQLIVIQGMVKDYYKPDKHYIISENFNMGSRWEHEKDIYRTLKSAEKALQKMEKLNNV